MLGKIADAIRPTLIAGLALIAGACTERDVRPTRDAMPAFMLGEFVDDYGIQYSIQADRWIQHPDARYHAETWYVDDQMLVARNDSDNPSDGDLWTRIDWLMLDESSEYEWAFCYAVYQAATPPDALAAAASERDTPRTGCNGFPFSRMKRVTAREGAH